MNQAGQSRQSSASQLNCAVLEFTIPLLFTLTSQAVTYLWNKALMCSFCEP